MTDTSNKPTGARLLYIYKVGNIAGAAVCALLCAICTALFFDYKPGYFKSHPAVTIFYISIACAVFFSLSTKFAFKKSFKLIAPTSKVGTPILSIIPACAFIYYAISITPMALEGSSKSGTYLWQALLSLVAFAYFFVSALEITANKNLLSSLGIISVIPLILIAVNSYFDYTTVMNGPDKLFMQFATVTFALLTINEIRFILGKPYPRFYVSLASISTTVCIISATSKACILIKGSSSAASDSLALIVLFSLLGVYSALRLVFLKEDAESDDSIEKDSNSNDIESQEEISDSDIFTDNQDANTVDVTADQDENSDLNTSQQ